jgi:hypothetical protein
MPKRGGNKEREASCSGRGEGRENRGWETLPTERESGRAREQRVAVLLDVCPRGREYRERSFFQRESGRKSMQKEGCPKGRWKGERAERWTLLPDGEWKGVGAE